MDTRQTVSHGAASPALKTLFSVRHSPNHVKNRNRNSKYLGKYKRERIVSKNEIIIS
jgi:hypothetical protein